ncbi:hypothetical protein FPQ18DRAFT_305551 [Pyronema domesticum]|uniref:Uncharacterized protein n=1 Tax=Pyronema omphalodes (strain CBS 100304) TaxID=1076935 RepID=U4LV10_PYROM|nr:hypothetical protein FPQ18DRAFT_305551 [Pyronema domesticum]CCX34177.1 Similar to hypothetical protein [Tuber melanosporum Mel28]; acc. no. XP_002835803 [Pyronema omphalodes CBS 100304]
MRRSNILRALLGVAALCTGVSAIENAGDAAGAIHFPGPSILSTPATPAIPAPEAPESDPLIALIKRSSDLVSDLSSLFKRGGIRNEADTKNLDLESWSRDTVKLCADKLNKTVIPNNPSGVAGCWNLPLLVDSTGIFAADLRIFRIADPTGDWKDVEVSSYNISVQYDGSAAIQPRNMTVMERRASLEGMKGSNLTKLVDTQFIGNLDKSLISGQLNDSELKVMVTPTISIYAKTKTGKAVNTTVSIESSKFLNGVFAETKDLNQKEKDEIKKEPFELPGTKIEIVPAGLYFYAAYTFVGLTIFGFGTLERAKFRDQYRSRLAGQGSR